MQVNTNINKMFIAQLPKNIIANMAYFIINIIIGVVLTPYFVSTLGVAAYGIIPLATSITGYVGLIILSLNTSVTRFLTVDLQKEDYTAANRTFNTSVFSIFAISALIAPILIIIAFFVPKIFNIPPGQEIDAILLFLGVFAAFIIRAWSGNYTVQLFAYNRLDLQNTVNIISVLSNFIFIVISFMLYGPNLALVGLASILSAIITSIIAIILAKKVCPYLKISISSIDLSRLKDLSSMSFWTIVDQIGTLLLLQIDLIIVNIMFGASSAGEYAIALQWVVLLRSVANILAGMLIPMILTYYAKEQIDMLIKMVISSVKLFGLIMALPIGLICGFAPQILTIWVGERFEFLAPLLILLTIHSTINYAVMPLFSINVAYNRMRAPGIVTIISGIINIILAIVLSLKTNWGYYSVAAAGMIVLTLKNLSFTPWYVKRIIGVKESIIIKSIAPGFISAILLIAVSLVIGMMVAINSFIFLILIGTALTVVYLILVWVFALSNFERMVFKAFIPKYFRDIVI